MAQSAFRWMVLGHREIADMITSADLPRHADPLPQAPDRQRRERQAGGSSRCSTTSTTSTRRCRRTSPSTRTTCSGATSGSARSGRARVSDVVEDRRLGQGAVRLGLPAPRRARRAEGLLEVRRGHGRATYLRLHGRQRAELHGAAHRQPRILQR